MPVHQVVAVGHLGLSPGALKAVFKDAQFAYHGNSIIANVKVSRAAKCRGNCIQRFVGHLQNFFLDRDLRRIEQAQRDVGLILWQLNIIKNHPNALFLNEELNSKPGYNFGIDVNGLDIRGFKAKIERTAAKEYEKNFIIAESKQCQIGYDKENKKVRLFTFEPHLARRYRFEDLFSLPV
ncbi:hypothetical protein FNU76_16725 [Chitinimonas arctica]|uniref:Uncharacterized protein n=1 Tax=Chitinimonas arctica TaxID=2594795 RepID=A0A516SI69_9NEIS|nr:hypothetical protein [Chitinimonas arctica]QDQ27857.1 hypothetical protein FNU76_16725 [Chitinimonas arctica]